MNHYLIFFLGMFIGCCAGLFGAALCVAAREADDNAKLSADETYGRATRHLMEGR